MWMSGKCDCVQGMYSNARSRVRVGEGYSEEVEEKVGVH